MKHCIQQGNQYPTPPSIPKLWLSRGVNMERTVRFADSSRYDASIASREIDVNKLFGLSYGYRGQHYDSTRVGWDYNKLDDCQDLYAYCYFNGKKNWNEQLRFPLIGQVGIEEIFQSGFEYNRSANEMVWYIDKTGNSTIEIVTSIPKKLASYGVTHGLYFGGNDVAPHDIEVDIS